MGNKIDAATSELEATSEIKLDKVNADNTKILNSFDMRLSALTSNKPSSAYEQPYDDLIKLLILK